MRKVQGFCFLKEVKIEEGSVMIEIIKKKRPTEVYTFVFRRSFKYICFHIAFFFVIF